MSIRFPKMHVAQSVVNRILNVADGLKAPPPAAVDRAPAVAEPELEGELLTQELAAPAPPVTADDATAEQIALKGFL